jgi:hypothetical protein
MTAEGFLRGTTQYAQENTYAKCSPLSIPFCPGRGNPNGVGYSSWLSPNIAADLAADTSLPLQIQSTASLIPQVSELEFLTNPITGNAYLVIDGAGPAIENQTGTEYLQLDSELETAGGPGYSTIGSPITATVGEWSYSTSATEPNGSTLDGTVNF